MKTIGIVLLWFLFIGIIASFVSCGSSHHCDAYGSTNNTNINISK